MGNPIEERENLIYQALNTLLVNPKTSILDFCKELNVDKEKLYEILDIINVEQYARKIVFSRGGMGSKILVAFYDTAVVTSAGANFIKDRERLRCVDNTDGIGNEVKSSCPTVFISYSWSDSSFTGEIETSLVGKAEVHRDKKDIKTWGSITEFMKTIRKQDFAVIIISDKYLRSDACLYELVQLMKDDDWNDKAMYVVMDDASIYNSVSRAKYILYWNEKCCELEAIISSLTPETSIETAEDLKKTRIISMSIGVFLNKVADSNNPTQDKAIQKIQNRIITFQDQAPKEG